MGQNEWSRYLNLVKQSGGKKILIPAYKDMDPYDLPEEFSHLQAQDMSKLGFMQDLIRGIKKVTRTDEPKPRGVDSATANAMGAGVKPLLKRVFIFLEDGNWEDADSYCERILDQDPENAWAYLGKLMAELRIHRKEDLAAYQKPLGTSKNYQKVVRYGGDKMKDLVRLNERNEKRFVKIKKEKYEKALSLRSVGEYKEAYELLKDLNFKDSAEQLVQIKKIYGLLEIQVGSRVFLGSYEQGNANGDKRIEWIVLAKKNTQILIISRYALDCKPFDEQPQSVKKSFFKSLLYMPKPVTWETCSLRTWLNTVFLNTAFSPSKQKMIVTTRVAADQNPSWPTPPGNSTDDKIFLLSIPEVNQYFHSDEERKCKATNYAISQGVDVDKGLCCWWWLRSPGDSTYLATLVPPYGPISVCGFNVNNTSVAVRPALWVKLESLE